MIQCVAQPNETRFKRGQIKCFKRKRFEKFVNLSDCIKGRSVIDGFSSETTADSIDRSMRKLEDRPPGGLERDSPSRLGENRIEAAYGGLGASSGDPLDKARETVEPWVERKDPDGLENAAECRQSQHPVGIVNSGTCPAAGRRERSKQQYPDDAECNIVDDVRQCCAPHRQPGADRHHRASRCGPDALADDHRAGLVEGH
jgi:hypothetical protein